MPIREQHKGYACSSRSVHVHVVQSGGGGGDRSLGHRGEGYYLVRAPPPVFRQLAHVKGLAVKIEGNHGALATAKRQGRRTGR